LIYFELYAVAQDSAEESGRLHIAVRGAGLITRWTCSWRDQQCSNSSDY